MNIKYLFTRRDRKTEVYYDIVFEWEDILMQKLGLRSYYYEDGMSDLGGGYVLNVGIFRRLIRRSKFLMWVFAPHAVGLKFDMSPVEKARYNSEHILPWIIDFYLEETQFKQFNDAYTNHPLVLISSKEVYEKLLAKKDVIKNVNLRHVALSISDKYKISEDTKFKKEYDVALMGRTNPVLEEFFYRYAKAHQELKYVYRKIDGENYNYCAVHNGVETYIGAINKREEYMDLMHKSRIGLYCTPDIDTDHARSHGYNQVTPRFLEWIASGAHVIARYVPNPDTEYYRLQDFSEPIETYEQFEKAMEYAMTHEVDMLKYANYLAQHYTSVRAEEIKRIISEA